MTGNDASKRYDVIFLLENHYFLYHFQTYKHRPHFLGEEQFTKLDEALAKIPKDRDLYVVTSGEHFYEDIVSFDYALKDEKLIRALIDEHIDKNPSISEPIHYHWYPLTSSKSDPLPRYYIFGYGSIRYTEFEKTFQSFSKMRVLTSSRQLLFNAVKQVAAVDEAFIAVYRFHDIEIMAVSNGRQLIFSRVHHYVDQSEYKDLTQSVNYVRQRFKQYAFTVYLGGSFENMEQLQDTFNVSQGLAVKNYNQNSNYADIINGIVDLKDDYNFLPLGFKSKRLFYKVIRSISLILFFITVYFLVSLIHSINEYTEAKTDYDVLKERYTEALHVFTPKETRLLDQLEVISKAKQASKNIELMTLLETLKPLKTMTLQKLAWNQENGTFTISLKHRFTSLGAFYAFEKKLEDFVKNFSQSYPKSEIHKTYDFSQLELALSIEQRKSSLRRGIRRISRD